MARPLSLCVLAISLVACGSDEDRGPGQLMDVAGRPPGDDCEAGGAVIRYGTDDDEDGVLDDEEVDEEELVCGAGSQGGTLVDLVSEPPGSHCEEGGVAIATGTDGDEDGELDEDEVSATEYVCGASVAANEEEIQGDVLVSNQLDAQGLIGVRVIHGDLVIDAPGLGSIDLSSLEEVDDLFAVDQFSLVELDAPALERVGLDLAIASVLMEQASLPALIEVGGSLEVTAPGLVSIDLASLESVGNDVTLGKVDLYRTALQAVELPSLVHAERGLDVEGLADLTALEVPMLEVTSHLSLMDNVSLTEVELSSATSIPNVSFRRNFSFATCRAEEIAAQVAAVTITIADNDDGGECP